LTSEAAEGREEKKERIGDRGKRGGSFRTGELGAPLERTGAKNAHYRQDEKDLGREEEKEKRAQEPIKDKTNFRRENPPALIRVEKDNRIASKASGAVERGGTLYTREERNA